MFGHLPGLPHINNEGFYDVVLEKRGGNCPPSPPLATPLALNEHGTAQSPYKRKGGLSPNVSFRVNCGFVYKPRICITILGMRTRIFCLAPAMVYVRTYVDHTSTHACMHTHTRGTPRTHACMCTYTRVTFRPESKSDLRDDPA